MSRPTGYLALAEIHGQVAVGFTPPSSPGCPCPRSECGEGSSDRGSRGWYTRGSLGEGGEDAGELVVYLGGGLAGVGAQDAPGVLVKPALVRDRRGEEEGVERRAVESFPA